MNNRVSLFFALTAVCSTSVWAEATPASPEDHSLATDIANYYTKSFPTINEAPQEERKDQKDYEARPAKLSEKTKREVVFNSIFKKSPRYTLLQLHRPSVLNEYAWGDLHLFYGTTSQPTHHLMSRINRTTTTLGEGVLATLLATPTNSTSELYKRQHILQTLLANEEVVAQLKKSLGHYREAEQSVLSLWTPSDPLYTKEYRNYMNKYFYAKNDEKSNKSAGWLEFKKRFFRDFFDIQYRFLWPVTLPTALEIFNHQGMSNPMPLEEESITQRKFFWMGTIPYYGGWYKWDVQTRMSPNASTIFTITAIMGEGLYTWTAYAGISNYLEYASVLRNLALRMADVQAFVVAATEISDQVAGSPTLEALYGDRLTHIRKLLAQSQENTELGRLVGYLQNMPYKNWSYFFNNAGKLLASHKLFTEYKDEFADAMYELGELDAFVSISTLIHEAQAYHPDHAYTFTKYLDRSQKTKPYVKLDDMWNPFLDAGVAVGNSVEMDAVPGGVRNIILTGPNAGGKSTFLTGVATSVLLSQTFGIAPAQEAFITPFDKINTSIDITDDIAAGKSLFMAEVDRAQKHLNMLDRLKQDEFSFSIFDEPFSGTNPTEGAAAEYSILEAMADYTNTLNIVATHYPIVMLLEKNASAGGFSNYKVYITYKEGDKKLNYTYKVVRGASNQAIAIDILEEQGYDTRLLRRAREIIAHPERYQSTFK